MVPYSLYHYYLTEPLTSSPANLNSISKRGLGRLSKVAQLRVLKEEVERSKYPEPLKTLILTAPDTMTEAELLKEFMKWRQIARIKDGGIR